MHAPAAKVPLIWDAGVQLFLDDILRSSKHPIGQHVLNTLLSQVRLERDGHPINRSAVKGCVDVLLRVIDAKNGDIMVYKTDFEPQFLKASEEFYDAEAELMIETCDASEYLRRVSPPLHSVPFLSSY